MTAAGTAQLAAIAARLDSLAEDLLAGRCSAEQAHEVLAELRCAHRSIACAEIAVRDCDTSATLTDADRAEAADEEALR